MSTALVTGATAGLGRALAESFAVRGWDLVVTARDASRLAETVSALREHGHEVLGLAGDVCDPPPPDGGADVVPQLAGERGLDLLVLNASTLGPVPLGTLRELSADDLAHVLAVNVVGPHALTRSLLTPRSRRSPERSSPSRRTRRSSTTRRGAPTARARR